MARYRHQMVIGPDLPDGWSTLDDTISTNVSKLLEAKGWTRSTLADRLSVSRQRVHDMLHTRPGRDQREFRWWELVALCGALDCTLYDLVLPEPGIELVRSSRVIFARFEEGAIPQENRETLSWRLFGLPPNYVNSQKLMDNLRENASTEAGKRLTELLAWFREQETGNGND